MITLNESQISDLFFNHDNRNVRLHVADEQFFVANSAKFVSALTKDADEFAELVGGQVTAEWLVKNYRERL